MSIRCKAVLPANALNGLGHIQSLRLNCINSNHWSHPPADMIAQIAEFKSAVKSHYHSVQLRRCCYCSIELLSNQQAYQLEHVLARAPYPQFMFELLNLAASCGSCNGAKSAKNVLAESLVGVPLLAIPALSTDYILVHPHMDDWSDHLRFGEFGQIQAKDEKGKETIKICGLVKLNAVRIADKFGSTYRREAEGLLINYFRYKQPGRKRNLLELLKALASNSGNQAAHTLVERIEQDDFH